MQNNENTTFVVLLVQSFALERTQNDSKYHLKYTVYSGREGKFVKNKTHKSLKSLKNGQK